VNAFDVILICVLIAGAVLGLARGLMRIVIGLLSIVVAFYLASHFQDPVAAFFTGHHVGQTTARIAAYVVIFVGTMIAGGVVAWIVGKILKLAMLSWADRLAGGAVGVVGAALAGAFLVHPLASSAPGGSRLLAESKLAPYLATVADIGNKLAPDSVAKRYDEGIATMRKVWRGEVPKP
jgi:membrane protein required for colicin V production